MNFVCFNGHFYPSGQPLLTIQNRSYKYGDGLFETMKVFRGQILLKELHFERLFTGLKLLKFTSLHLFETDRVSTQILELCAKNNCTDLARVRLSVYRNESIEYAIEALPLSKDVNTLNKEGFDIDICPDIRKSQDAISNLKTANYLPYVLADIYATEKKLNDSLVLNGSNHVCDASKANIFLIKKDEIFTPALHQGCVAGVMRQYLIDWLKKNKYVVHQKEIQESELVEADEVFLSNAIYGIRWVGLFKGKQYRNILITKLYANIYSPYL